MAEAAFRAVKLSPMRRMIAARMSDANQTIPHFRLVASVEVDRLIALRRAMNDASGDRVTLNDLLVKACAMALLEVPEVNVQWMETELHHYAHADITVVTAVPGGLTTPIVRGADLKSVLEISREIRTLSERAARHALKMDEILGGSFGISNLGMFGIEQFDAIINPPQCAMLAVGKADPRLVVDDEGAMRIANILRMTLSVDHRAIDGATAAAFMSALRRHLGAPKHLAEVTR